jgi:PhoPQ-activated pathogenicity-related protein
MSIKMRDSHRFLRLAGTGAFFALAATLLPFSSALFAVADPLRDYVERPDDAYAFVEEGVHEVGSVRVHILRLTSQEWQGIEWRHRLTVVIPRTVRHPEAAVLLVAGGSNARERPLDFSRREAVLASQVASASGCVVAVLEHVPNQPLLGGLYEDDLIAHTFAQQLRTGNSDWPLLFPMVKSTARAMDAVTAFLTERNGAGPREFIVTGASKRGWTTWLTAAVDPRVKGIAPMVFDILNFGPQLELQRASFDGYSPMIQAYEERNLFALLDSQAGAELGRQVDPFTYRERLQMPKLVLLGTNDPYWSVDAAGLYFGDLPGPKHLFYAANAGHGLGLSIAPTLLAFVQKTLQGDQLPHLAWNIDSNSLTATWEHDGGEAWLWSARSLSRDFQEAKWRNQRLDGEGTAMAPLDQPAEGYVARYIEVRFPAGGGAFGLSTEIVVTPAAETRPGE